MNNNMNLIVLLNVLVLFTVTVNYVSSSVIGPKTRRPRKEKIKFIPPAIRPRLLIFNLDRTIWPLIMDDIELPYKINRKQIITDDCGNRLGMFPHTYRMLQDLLKMKFKLAALCYYKDFDTVEKLLKMMKVSQMFEYKEFSYNSKFDQIEKIHNASKIPFDEMILFDLDDDEFLELELFDLLSFRVDQKGCLMEHVEEAWKMYATKKSQPTMEPTVEEVSD